MRKAKRYYVDEKGNMTIHMFVPTKILRSHKWDRFCLWRHKTRVTWWNRRNKFWQTVQTR